MFSHYQRPLRLYGLLSILAGIFLLFAPTAALSFFCSMIALLFLIAGILLLAPQVLYQRRISFLTLLAILLLLLGGYILLRPSAVIRFFHLIAAMLLFLHALASFLQASARRQMLLPWGKELCFSALLACFGLLLLWNPFTTASLLVQTVGITLLLSGISDIYFSVE